MTFENIEYPNPRPLETVLKEHLDNTIACSQALNELFLNLKNPETYISEVKNLEEKGDKLIEEVFCGLEQLPYSELTPLTEQLVKRMDDIVDGINNTARLIDICHPKQIENAAQDILSTLVSMTERLKTEIASYPGNEISSVKACAKTLKTDESTADTIYHEWRKKQRRVQVLSLIEETNWTEILGVLERTTDAAYHTALLLERITRYRHRP